MKILTKPRYTFSDYFDLPYSSQEILSELGYHYEQTPLNLPKQPIHAPDLERQLQKNLKRTSLPNESSRRESLVYPILIEVCDHLELDLRIEYPIQVSDQFSGLVDYYIKGTHTLLVVEAKQADLTRGFTQLATEMIGFSQWANLPQLYGAVTTGNIWVFGTLNQTRISEDTQIYTLFDDLNTILEILTGILSLEQF
ncbi:hypothetical protein HJG54_07530 [Leptolyngbya sp. NK1-12]|uniref:Type I restriction enzyme R protein N-terminal domain-containing protein n=1 Tax=Leptolyngbya sp. NK1-12 TaxID=2547451 RepID=A0AA96WJX2_9CYAN|nr:hypothetical protein [Leptolyngbya sp. NK1-12]WNZ22721.1 hypothetical protein HJG54_07530 [Leptolyngbya sp. NK1-12]